MDIHYGGSASPARAVSEAVSRLLVGCYPCVSVSRLQSADVSLDLTGTGAPPVPTSLTKRSWEGLAVFLYRVTDKTLAGLLPVLQERLLTFLVIAGEQPQTHSPQTPSAASGRRWKQ